MVDISRRNIVAGSAVLAAAASCMPAYGFAPPINKPAAGFYRYKVGEIEVTVVNDGVSRMPLTDDFVSNVPKDRVNAALDALFMEKDFYAGPYNPIVVNNGKQLALIDTGTGELGFKGSNGLNGRLMLGLAAAGIDPATIDVVIASHYHGDHINGILKADNTLAFPNAEILVPEPEHKFWMDDGEMSRTTNPRVEAGFRNARRVLTPEVLKRLRTYQTGKEVIAGVTALSSPGHTPGHHSHIISSGNKTVFAQADVTHAPFLFARNPGWHIALDVDPVMAEATRRKIYDMLAADRMTVQGFHYPFPAVAHIEKTSNGYREVMVQWSPVL